MNGRRWVERGKENGKSNAWSGGKCGKREAGWGIEEGEYGDTVEVILSGV